MVMALISSANRFDERRDRLRVLGVTPPEFHGPYVGLDLEGYLPLSSYRYDDALFTNRTDRSIRVVARMKPDVSVRAAQSSLDVLARRIEQQYPATDQGISVRVIPEPEARPTPASTLAQHNPVFFLLLLAGVVLALACMNVANLLLVRGTVRQRELAIRAALGSGRARLIRQALTESLLLAMLGAVGGLILGKWGSDGFASSIDLATDFPTLLDFSFDWHVFAYAFDRRGRDRTPDRDLAGFPRGRDECGGGIARRRFSWSLGRSRTPASAQRAGDRTSRRLADVVDRRRPVRAKFTERAEYERRLRARSCVERPHEPGMGGLRSAAHRRTSFASKPRARSECSRRASPSASPWATTTTRRTSISRAGPRTQARKLR